MVLKYFLKSKKQKIKSPVFTTRADTIFGATYIVLAPEHLLVKKLIAGQPEESQVLSFIEKTLIKAIPSDVRRQRKKGMFIGRHAVNPVNGETIPIFIVTIPYGLWDRGDHGSSNPDPA